MKLIIVTGMPGAGKSEVADAFRRAGIKTIIMGDVIRDEARRRGLEASPENTRRIMLELREIDGPGAVAKRCVEDLKITQGDTVVIEGCRSIAEVEVFEENADQVIIICVHSAPRTRYERLCCRNRDDAPPSWQNFRERDLREISVGLGGVIALSEIMIVNDSSLEQLRLEASRLTERLA